MIRHRVKYGKNICIDLKCEIGPNVIFNTIHGGEIMVSGPSYFIGNTKLYSAGGSITIGKEVTLGDYCFVNGAGGVIIGDYVLFSDKVNIISENHNYEDVSKAIRFQGVYGKPISIGSGSWIGVNVTILSGTAIGRNSVVGANSVVKGEFPDYCVIAGNPARVIKRYVGGNWVKEID